MPFFKKEKGDISISLIQLSTVCIYTYIKQIKLNDTFFILDLYLKV